MARLRVFNLAGINTFVNPIVRKDTDFTRLVNVDNSPYGAKTKRPGYTTYLGTANGSAVTSLFSWTKDDGTTLFTYRASGDKLYYSIQGTGAWTVAGNGTIVGGNHVGHAILGNTLIIGDGAGSTRHTTNGTTFTDTTLAPIASDFVNYQNRIYAMGTASDEFYSTANDATNWNTSGTSDSSSIRVPGGGKLLKTFKLYDRLFLAKNSGIMYRWDGYNLVDMSTKLGPTSPYSYAQIEDYGLWLNNLGIFNSGGGNPQLISNPIQKQIYNEANTGIVGTTFANAPAVAHQYNYLISCGTVTDNFTNERLDDGIIKYDYLANMFSNYKFANFPTAWHSFKNASGNEQLIFGDATGQCYTVSGTATTDNGVAIESIIEGSYHLDSPELDKEFRWIHAIFKPGSEAKVQVSVGDTLEKASKNWIDIGDCSGGVTSFRFPQPSRGKFLFFKIYESSKSQGFVFYGFSIVADIISDG